MRGAMAVQHYTGSLVNVLLDNRTKFDKNSKNQINITPSHPQTYANVVKNKKHPNQFRPRQKHNNQGYSAQTQFGQKQNSGIKTVYHPSVEVNNRFNILNTNLGNQ